MKAMPCNPSLLETSDALQVQVMLQRWVTGPLFWLVDRWDLQAEMAVGEIHNSPSCFGSILEALSPWPGKRGPWWVWLDNAGTGTLCCRTPLLNTKTVSVRPSLSNSCLLFGLLVLCVWFLVPSSPLSCPQLLPTVVCLGSSEPRRTCLPKLKSSREQISSRLFSKPLAQPRWLEGVPVHCSVDSPEVWLPSARGGSFNISLTLLGWGEEFRRTTNRSLVLSVSRPQTALSPLSPSFSGVLYNRELVAGFWRALLRMGWLPRGPFPFAVAEQPDCCARDSTLLSLWLVSPKSGRCRSPNSPAEPSRFLEREMESALLLSGKAEMCQTLGHWAFFSSF